MKLVIVESPSKAKTIEKYLGKDFSVLASIGHVRDLPKSNKKAIDIEGGFIPHYEITRGKEKVIAEIKKEAKKADEVILATDPDREGEAIAWHLEEAIGLKNPKRIVFHEITKSAVEEALKHPRQIDQKLKTAQEARRVLDRLVGYDLSGLIWKKVRYGLSAGRVQSPALRILVERERQIRDFKSTPYFIIHGNFKNKKGEQFECVSEEILDQKLAEKFVSKGRVSTWQVDTVEETKVMRSPRAPFTTSTLQQTASSRLGYSPSNTMRIAQKLYEKGLITYMRTDSTNLSGQAIAMLAGIVSKEFGKELHQARTYKTKSKNAQEAHEAIRPTDAGKKSAGATEDEKKLYRLIWSRAVSSQMIDAETMRTTIEVKGKSQNAKDELPTLKTVGTRVIKDGWLLADPGSKGEDVILPKVVRGETLTLVSLENERKETVPPPRYSEAGLVKELEKRGIGRPSTYASIIKTLYDREYVTRESRSLKPTDTGEVVSTFLEDNFGKYISDTFTAEMENELDEIAEGTREYKKTLSDFYGPFVKEVHAKADTAKITTLGEAADHHKCPKCGASMVVKLSRGGRFLSCSRFPACDGALTIDGLEIKKDEPLGIDPETGLPIFVKTGRFGPYVQVGEGKNKKVKVKRASIPKDKNPAEVSLEEALKYLSLPRVLGTHPETGETISASVGRFGPYIVHQKDFRSLKAPDNPYDINLARALEIFSLPKKHRKHKVKE